MSTLGKRQGDDLQRPNKRIRQREQKKVARHISTQPANKISTKKDVDEKKTVKLPSQLQVENYLSAYQFEIQSLQNAIKSSSVGSSIRAWQMLPRHKRRRNASHNLLALPRRLRDKGQAELRASKTMPRSRSEMRKRKGKGDRMALGAYPRAKESNRRKELVQRATNAAMLGKGWMETHLWHTKRFRMSSKEGKYVGGEKIATEDRWGYSLAEESSMKSYRSTWRDEKKAASIMDVSYDAWIRISASVRAVEESCQAEEALAKLIQKAGLSDGWQEEWRDGRRCCKTLLTAPTKLHSDKVGLDEYATSSYLRCRAPVQVIWVTVVQTSSPENSLRKRREILLRTHPAATSSLERSLHTAIVALSRTLGSQIEIKRLNSLPHPLVSAGSGAAGRRHATQGEETKVKNKTMIKCLESLQKKWMRIEAFNVFELTGPTAKNLMAKVLRPINGENGNKIESILKGALPDGTIIPLDVHDPRLSFPPRMSTSKTKPNSKPLPTWSTHSRLFTQGYISPSFRKGEIDRRKSNLPIPGSRLLPTSRDDVVPVVVIAHHQEGNGNALSLLVPRGWGQAFWLSLVHPGTRVIGQVQSHALNFDRGKPSFPFDWVGTPGYQAQEQVDSLIASATWHRRPPAKRCNFDKVGVRWPFGGTGLWMEVIRHGWNVSNVEDSRDDHSLPWTFALTKSLPIDALTQDYQVWKTGGDKDGKSSSLLKLIKSALICVKLTACRKGSFDRWDEIHYLDEAERKTWKKAFQVVQQDSHSKSVLQKLESKAPPSSNTHIGSVTTSNFSLSNGKTSALASISLLAYLEIITSEVVEEVVGSHRKERNPIPVQNLVLIKSIQGGVHRAASIQAVSLI